MYRQQQTSHDVQDRAPGADPPSMLPSVAGPFPPVPRLPFPLPGGVEPRLLYLLPDPLRAGLGDTLECSPAARLAVQVEAAVDALHSAEPPVRIAALRLLHALADHPIAYRALPFVEAVARNGAAEEQVEAGRCADRLRLAAHTEPLPFSPAFPLFATSRTVGVFTDPARSAPASDAPREVENPRLPIADRLRGGRLALIGEWLPRWTSAGRSAKLACFAGVCFALGWWLWGG